MLELIYQRYGYRGQGRRDRWAAEAMAILRKTGRMLYTYVVDEYFEDSIEAPRKHPEAIRKL
jgi:hypothetical protein